MMRNGVKLAVICLALFIGFRYEFPPGPGIENISNKSPERDTGVSLVILGTVQDAGSPHIGCNKACCRDLFIHPNPGRQVVCLGLIDPVAKKSFLFEATPDITRQMKNLRQLAPFQDKETPDGIFITHAHVGHYSGLMYLGKEAMNASELPVHVMPRFKRYLEQNGPWDQLVRHRNIAIQVLNESKTISLTENVDVTPMLVPHRDEYSETVGFIIQGPNKKALFIPDIDKWEKWDRRIIEAIMEVDYAFIDGTFYNSDEIGHRDISEIPHPFITESMKLFSSFPVNERKKIYFIHFNHTNPALNPASKASKEIIEKGYNIARFNDVFDL